MRIIVIVSMVDEIDNHRVQGLMDKLDYKPVTPLLRDVYMKDVDITTYNDDLEVFHGLRFKKGTITIVAVHDDTTCPIELTQIGGVEQLTHTSLN